jgi:uncharacterized membrane-anchored protein YhcB (DUF1043 family)
VYSLTVLIVAAIVALALGLAGGWLAGARSTSESRRSRELEHKLDQMMQDKKAYEDEVTQHFSETARLLNNLTQNYREVHSHLASGAANLCPDQSVVALGNLDASADPNEIPAELADVRAPLDYAPKTSPDEQGMLSEDFGLEKSATPGVEGAPESLEERRSA